MDWYSWADGWLKYISVLFPGLASRVTALEKENVTMSAKFDALKANVEALVKANTDLKTANATLTAENAALKAAAVTSTADAEVDALNTEVTNALNPPPPPPPPPAEAVVPA